jgi:hypothetical protein
MIRLLATATTLAAVLATAGCGRPSGPFSGGARDGAALAAQARSGAAGADDAVKRAILPGAKPPATIFEVRERLLARGGKLETHIVANRGHENPEGGSFSFFEAYSGPMEGGVVKRGELFIGFFSEREGAKLAVQQRFDPGLMIELIAWDYTKRKYNFWELVGTGQGSAWKYRGDSADVLDDVAKINTGAASADFGAKLRCSGCHTLGGPIMKELAAPNNDWWTDAHKLELGSLKLAAADDPDLHARAAAGLFRGAKDASNLASLVKAGTDRLLAERARQGGDGQDLRQELRSLFAPMEMNLASDGRPYRERAGGEIALPAGFFVDERLAPGAKGPAVATARYADALRQAGSRFAADEAPGLAETRHAFLVPVRSYVDQRQLDALVGRGLLDEELIADVLAVDLTTPLYSAARASLVRHVPAAARDAADLRAKLQASLAGDRSPAARELLANLTDPTRTAAAHRKRALAFLAACEQARASKEALAGWLRIASQRRAEVAAAPTSQNPRGTILEPGFRVIFPEDRLAPEPGALALREADCGCGPAR